MERKERKPKKEEDAFEKLSLEDAVENNRTEDIEMESQEEPVRKLRRKRVQIEENEPDIEEPIEDVCS